MVIHLVYVQKSAGISKQIKKTTWYPANLVGVFVFEIPMEEEKVDSNLI